MNRRLWLMVAAVCVLICVAVFGTCFAGKTNESNPLTSMQGLLIVFCASAVVGIAAAGLGRRR